MRRPKRKKLRMGQIVYHTSFPRTSARVTSKEDGDEIDVTFEREVAFRYSNRSTRDWTCSVHRLHPTSNKAGRYYSGSMP